MSGGRLVVLDHLGQAKKVYPLEEGLATIGSDHVCDIRVMLPTVSPHHATVVVHTNQAVVRSVAGETRLNGAPVSVAALRHGDELRVGGRALRWEYAQPTRARLLAPLPQPLPALVRRAERARRRRRSSEPAATRAPLHVPRASMPASTSEKQIAIVQPQRRDTSVPAEASSSNVKAATKRPRTSRNDEQDSEDSYSSKRKPPGAEPRLRRCTPLRLSALRAAHRQRHSAPAVAKIRAPAEIDHTKQAAIMLMTRHTPKAKRGASLVLQRPSPVRRTPKGKAIGATPKRASTYSATRTTQRGSGQTTSVLEITDSDSQTIRGSNISERSPRKSSLRSPVLASPKKSALKDPSARRSTRKTESIKFDLSNLEGNPQDRSSDILFITEAKDDSYDSGSNDELTLHYSDTSSTKSKSPSPRRSIHSRSSSILEKSLGTTFTHTPRQEQSTLTPESPRGRKSVRGSLILQKALENSTAESSEYSKRMSKTGSEQSYSTTITSARKTKTLSPRSSKKNLESYSIVDLVSIDSNESVYNSAGSNSEVFDTPQTIASRRTRSNKPSLLGSSTPYLNRTSSPKPDTSTSTCSSRSRESKISTRRSASMTTPKNSRKQISFNSTKVTKASRSRSRINDSDVQLVDDDREDSSPKSSRRISKASLASPIVRKNISLTASPAESPINGTITPENHHSPEEATTPVLSIQSFLDQSVLSQNSSTSRKSQPKTTAANLKRKTIGANISHPKRNRMSIKSRSLDLTRRRSLRARKRSIVTSPDDEIVVTPKSAVKLVQEGVKNKHSTAKKPTSKRSIIDNLDESAFVKELFNSPVKRKLSQSMTEFSRRELLDDEDIVRKPTRNTIAFTGRTPDHSLMNDTEAITPEVFVSPLSTPGNSPNLSGIKRLFAKSTPENDLRNVRGVKALLRTPRDRKSIKNDLSNISGVKRVFARSPRNRLSDVRVKEVFAPSPNNDLRRASGVKALFQSVRTRRSPKNTLEDVRGVKNLFRKSPSNNLQRLSGVKTALRVNSPRNDLTDVRGVKQLYRKDIRNDLSDLSGVEELFNESNNLDTTFDQLMGKPRVRYYAKAKSFTKITVTKKQTRKTKSLHDSIGQITSNVEEWLENELKKRVQKPNQSITPKKSTSKSNVTRELQKLTTDTIEGTLPIRTSRARNSTLLRSVNAELPERKKSASELYSAHTLPIKKRSLVDAANGSGDDSRNRLPIKKRAVLHSTPMKGRAHVTLNASELGRVSPIAPAAARITQTAAEPSKILKEKTIKSIDVQKAQTSSKPSPRRRRGKATVECSPQVRLTRGRKTKDPQVTNAKKQRSSIVITKKPPIMSPKAEENTEKVGAKVVAAKNSPKRSTRQKSKVENVTSPRKTRGKTQKSTETKPLQAKPQSTRQAKTVIATVNNDAKETRRRKTTVDSSNSKTQASSEKAKRTRKTKTDISKTNGKTDNVPPPVKRGRRNIVEPSASDENKTRNTRKKAVKEISDKTQKEVKKQKVEPEPRPTRGRRAKDSSAQEIDKPSKTAKESTVNKRAGRQRKTTVEVPPVDSNNEVVVKKTRRGRKAVEIVDVKANEKVKSVESVSDDKKGRRGAKKIEVELGASNVAGRTTRKTAQKLVEVKPSRGIRTKQVAVVEQEAPKAAARKRKTNDQTDTKEAALPAKRRRAAPEQSTVSRSRRR